MNPTLSPDAFNTFFAWAPWIIGLLIYLAFFVAKRHEGAPARASSSPSESFACAQCGRRGARDQWSRKITAAPLVMYAGTALPVVKA